MKKKRIKRWAVHLFCYLGQRMKTWKILKGMQDRNEESPLLMCPGRSNTDSSQAGIGLCCAPTAPSIALQRVDVLAGRGILATRLNPWQQKRQTVKAASGTCQREMKELKLYYCARVRMAERRPQNHLGRRRVLHRRNRQYFSTKWIDY